MKTEKEFHPRQDCPIRHVYCRLSDKWSVLTLMSLYANGVMRFSDIFKSVGDISQRMLTVTLRSLEADGLVKRSIYPEIPPRVEYELTQTGKSLMPHLSAQVEWAAEHMQDIVKSRRQHEAGREVQRFRVMA